jgi:hypothetical protein
MNLAVGDLHGRTSWKDINFQKYDNVYFLGDYFDTHENFTASQQIENFKSLAKEACLNKSIHLCIGNHDLQYLDGVDEYERYSGFQNKSYWPINKALTDNINLLKFVYMYNDFLISHAGISEAWMKNNYFSKLESINDCIKNKNYLPFYFNGIDPYGDDIIQSCIWIRPKSLLSNQYKNYRQIVGHTPMDTITTIQGITFCDCLLTHTDFLEFE